MSVDTLSSDELPASKNRPVQITKPPLVPRDFLEEHAETKGTRMISIFEMSPQDRERLEKQLSKTKGWAQIWVHTHYKEEELPDNERASEYLQSRKRMIDAHNEHTMPVIAFVEHGFLNRYKELYTPDSNTTHPKTIYFVETAKDDPVPYIGDITAFDPSRDPAYGLLFKDASDLTQQDMSLIEKLSEEDARSQNNPDRVRHIDPDAWQAFQDTLDERIAIKARQAQSEAWHTTADLFKQLGIQHVLIRGRNYSEKHYTHEDFLEENPYLNEQERLVAERQFRQGAPVAHIPGECVGDTYNHLVSEGIPVTLSKITYPQTASPEIKHS